MAVLLHQFFDAIYIINLRSRPDRLREVRAQLETIGVPSDAPNVHWHHPTKPTDAAGFPSAGARGCFMSHLAVLTDARDRGVGSVLILEDDFNAARYFDKRFEAVAQHLNSHEWGMFHGVYVTELAQPAPQSVCVPAMPAQAVQTTSMVAVNGSYIAALVEYLQAMLLRPPGDPAGGSMHVDGAYCWFRTSHPEMTTWLASPQLGYQRSSRTDVHDLRWWDRQPVLRFITTGMRKFRNAFR